MTRRGKIGAWAAHVALLEKIANEKINNALILEDDCFQVRDFNLEDLGDQPIYLNGTFHHPTNYAKRDSPWVEETLKTFKPENGINEIDWTKIRVLGALGIFIPKWEQALEIANKLKEVSKYTTIDSQLSKQHLIGRFYYPALFRHSDFQTSNISKGGWGEIEYWKEKDMRLFKRKGLLPIIH
jgi:GR25 family glycosyltransferase involved in LPS biosynthesis